MATVLCVDDTPSDGVLLRELLSGLGHTPVLASSVAEAWGVVERHPPDLIISDYKMPTATGLEFLERLQEGGYRIPLIMITAYSSVEHAVRAIRHGAVDYLTKPLRAEALRLAVNGALELFRLRCENENMRRELHSLRRVHSIVGSSPALQQVLETIAAVATTRATVLLEGESGTGKELFARAIHEQSPRRDGPFITVNCAAMPEGLVESTLFGHERGAFTGANARAYGAFERANRGSLLLDEISEMRLDLQAKLLRVIQEQEFERVGGQQPVRVDVRLIVTTNRDLAAEVEAGRFRRDLYYRLNVVPIRTPALRDRIEDLAALVEHFVGQVSNTLGVRAPEVSSETLGYLGERPWPGNVRELANAVERAVILCRNRSGDRTLRPEDFELDRRPLAGSESARTLKGDSEGEVYDLDTLERRAIQRALAATGGLRTRAAELLGISERTLRNKLNGPRSRPNG
jgi:DNA-binding NtrC family response regulator